MSWPGSEPLPAEPGPTRAILARTFAYLFGAGGLLALLTLLLPHGPGRVTAGIAFPAFAALAVAVVNVVAFDRIPIAVFRWLPPLGTVLATLVVFAGDRASTIPYTGFYFWVVLSAFYLFEMRWGWLNVGFVGVGLAIVLELSPHVGDRVLAWVMVMGGLAVGGGMIGLLRSRLEAAAVSAQRALQRSQESERALAEAQQIAKIGSWAIDLETRAFTGSQQLFEILGLDADPVTDLERVTSGFDSEERERVIPLFRAAIEDGREIHLEHVVHLPTRGRRVLETRARVVTDEGRVPCFVGTTQDVTLRRAQEDVLRGTLRRLRATIDVALELGRESDPASLLRLISDRARSLLQAEAVSIELEDGDVPEGPGDGARRTLRAPLAYRGETYGVLTAKAATGRAAFTSDDEEMLRAFASSAAAVVSGARMVREEALGRSIEAAERERRRFARELHDQTLQGLGALAMLLESVQSGDLETLRAANERGRRLIDEEVENLRRIIADLRPSVLDDLGLAPALEALTERVRAEHGIDAVIDIDAGDGLALEPATERTVYRVVQEALTNVYRHAHATRVRATLVRDREALVVRVADNGRGFDEESTEGFGLAGMRERLSLVGATLSVTSGPSGTVLEARVPVAVALAR